MTSATATTATSGGYVWLGSYRFLLAFLVFSAHGSGLWNYYFNLIAPGALGVFLFFAVSGYIIVSALENFYNGRYISFLTNRALRIYPTFWGCYFLSIGALYLYGADIIGGTNNIPDISRVGLDPKSLLMGVTIVGGYFDADALSPNAPAWSIVTELFFYFAAAGAPLLFGRYLGQARALGMTGAVALLGAAFVWATEGSARFYGALGFAPFFVAGAVHWYLRHGRGGMAGWALWLTAMAGCAVFILSADSYHLGRIVITPTRVNQLIAFLGLYGVFSLCAIARLRSARLMRIDRFIGDLTYPVYLCHLPVIAILWHDKTWLRGPFAFFSTFLLCVLVAYIVRVVCELSLVRLRNSVRGQRLTAT